MWEWLVMYEHARDSKQFGRIKQTDVDRLIARQKLIDEGADPWQLVN